MIRDKLNILSNAQAITVTAASTDYLDLGTARDLGRGQEIWAQVRVHTAFTTSDAADLTVALQADDNTSFSSATTLLQSASAIAAATLVAGYHILRVRIPISTPERYMRFYFTVGTGSFTAGKVDAELLLDVQADHAYAKGYTN